jgi:hypothetical protein
MKPHNGGSQWVRREVGSKVIDLGVEQRAEDVRNMCACSMCLEQLYKGVQSRVRCPLLVPRHVRADVVDKRFSRASGHHSIKILQGSAESRSRERRVNSPSQVAAAEK